VSEISDITIAATVTRANLDPPLAVLDLNDEINYTLGRQLDVGSVSWRREVVTSPFVHGRFPIHEVKDAAESRLMVYTQGADHAGLKANIEQLLQAFTEQYDYELRIQVEGQDYHWRCERADYQVGFVTEMLAARFVPVVLSFHRHPIQAAGAF